MGHRKALRAEVAVGLNLVIGCHRCAVKVWFYRGQISGMEGFYRDHWQHERLIELSNDQADRDWLDAYRDVGERYGVVHRDPAIA